MTSANEAFPYPHKELTKINGTPKVTDIQTLLQEIYANAISVHSTSGGGSHGHLGAIVEPAAYLILTNQPLAFTIPGHPGPPPAAVHNDTAAQIANNNRLYDDELRYHSRYTNVVNSLKQLVIAAVPEMFISSLKDPTMGYANITTLAILEHLHTEYGIMKHSELEANRESLKAPWNPDQPLVQFWNRVAAVRTIAATNNVPIDDGATIELCKHSLGAAGVYGHALLTWETTTAAASTWPQFQAHFKRYEKARLKGLQTAQQAGFHGANLLYTATGLPIQATPAPATPPPPATPATVPTCERCNNATQQRDPPRDKNTIAYCWTHGIMAASARHNSSTCRHKAEGHQTNATIYNRYNGCLRVQITDPTSTGRAHSNRPPDTRTASN